MDTILKYMGTIGTDPALPGCDRVRLTPFIGLLDRILLWFETRRQLEHLAGLDERLLRDIGVCREDALRALQEHSRKGMGQ